jgi:hypothetical protein
MKNMSMKKKIEKLSILDKRAFETGDPLLLAFVLVIIMILASQMSLENLALVIIIFLAPTIVIYKLTQNAQLAIIYGTASGTALGYNLGIIPLELVVPICIALAIIIIIYLGRREQ